MRTQRRMFHVLAALTAAGAWSCTPTDDPSPPPPAGFHAGFLLSGAHALVDCADCHIAGAAEQGVAPERDNGWANALSVECAACHSDDPPAQHYPQACSDSGCHAASDFCWAQVWRPCDGPIDPDDTAPPPTPIPLDHEGDTALVFPLEGPHALGCAVCHPTAPDFTPQIGGGTDCSSCHPRVELPIGGPGPDHYPPDRIGGTDDERGCKACHARNDASGKLQVSADWLVTSYLHEVVWPHAVVESWDANPEVLQDPSLWVASCTDCHTTPGVYTTWTCSVCHPQATLDVLSSLHVGNTQPCTDCHPEAN